MQRKDTEVWQSFIQCSHTIPTIKREYPEWHQGRARFCVWAILLDQPAVQERLDRVQQGLKDFLVWPYQRQAHVTLSACGFWQPDPRVVKPEQYDNFSSELLDRQLQALDRLSVKPFQLEVGGLNSFSSAPYLEVAVKGEQLSALRSCMPGYFEEIREVEYTPHVTVGCYRDRFKTESVVSCINAFGFSELSVVVDVNELALLSYSASDIGSPLVIEKRYQL